MPRGDKSKYTDKQKRQAEHIEEGYESRGVSEEEAARRAWATVNKATGGGKKSGSGRGKAVSNAPAKKGGAKGGKASGPRSAAPHTPGAQNAARPPALIPHPVGDGVENQGADAPRSPIASIIDPQHILLNRWTARGSWYPRPGGLSLPGRSSMRRSSSGRP